MPAALLESAKRNIGILEDNDFFEFKIVVDDMTSDVSLLITDFADDEEDFEEESKLAHFYRAVKTLNMVEKALILLFIEGQSHKQIAANLGLSEVNTRVKLNRTKNKLKILIKNQGYEF